MALSAGARLGPYEIQSPLGAGGMGEVYRARDSRLNRTVAIKILPSADPELKVRFEREARAIAGLAHPHICTLYDVGQDAGTDYLVLEYLEGETLATRLQRGPLALDEVLKQGIEIAEALDKAHLAGVIHRDLKPGNIMLTRSGAKLLDFGLAKLRPDQGVVVGPSAVVTQTTPLTGKGSVVGTLQYMAPEQLKGRDADARSDLFALGTVLYEMVTGRKAFQGTSSASVIAAIMSTEPSIDELQERSTPALANVIKTCLIKNPEDRRQSAHDIALDLRWIASSRAVDATRSATGMRSSWKWVAIAAVLGASLAAAGLIFSFREPPARVMRASLPPPADMRYDGFAALSPDGSRLAFSARGSKGQRSLWIRSLETSIAVAIANTSDASYPFWSPDGRSVGFFADGKMKRVSAEPGSASSAVQTLANAPDPRGATWGADGTIVFSPNIEDGLYRVSAAGGDVTPVTTLDRRKLENSHRWPQFLPNGRFLFLARSSVPQHQGIYVARAGSNDRQLVLRTPFNAQFAAGPAPGLTGRLFGANRGYLLFMREQTLVAQPFDPDRLELGGEQSAIAESLSSDINRGEFSVSRDASLVYRQGRVADPEVVWFDRAGKSLGSAAISGHLPRLSPDEKQIVVNRLDPQVGAGDLWIEDLSRRVVTRLTSHPAFEWATIWSPNGDRIVFASNRAPTMNLYEKAVSGSQPERLLLKSDKRQVPTDWSRDGRFVLFAEEDPVKGWDLWALPMTGEGKPFPVVASEFNDMQGVFSPDGRWLAYTSDETGNLQVYVTSFEGHAEANGRAGRPGKWRISSEVGTQPKWRADGRELFYLSGDRKIMSATVSLDKAFEAGAPTPLFASVIVLDLSGPGPSYDVTADGRRFVMAVESDERLTAPMTLLFNWRGALRK